MKNNFAYFTTKEFAKLHHINRRTLHYYNEIDLFSPTHKGENGYRYYTYEQSMELENILALRELNMSLEEIKAYVKQPNSKDFLNLSNSKIKEIDHTIAHLKKLKAIFIEKKAMIKQCEHVYDEKIEIVDLPEEYLLMTPLPLNFDSQDNLIYNTAPIMDHLRAASELCKFKKSCGSFISLAKVKKHQFDAYDGIFTVIDEKKQNLYIRPKGKYIRGFVIGDWDKIPSLYTQILHFAKDHQLTLGNYAFESGLNEFTISDMDAYITKIEIPCICE